MALPEAVLAARDRIPTKPEAVTLTGRLVTLRPFVEADVEPLHAVSNGQPFALGERRVEAYDADAVVWRWMSGGPFRDAEGLRAHLVTFAATADVRMMTACDARSAIPVGIACLMANRPRDLKLELGAIWYGPIVQGTGVAREATLLMLEHAFGLGYRRVEWKCDARNERSRRSALSYGFTFEGLQEQHMIVKDDSRDTAWFRMLSTEWPAIRARYRTGSS